MKKAYLSFVVAVATLAFVSSAKANVINPGQTVAPDAIATKGTILQDTGLMPFTLADGTSGTVAELVVQDTASPYASGDYSFVYQVTVSSGNVGAITGYNYAGFLTDVEAGVGCGGSVTCSGTQNAPTSASRTADGGTIQFNFSPFVVAGQNSESLIIATNATSYHSGLIGVIDGAATTLNGWAPNVPEPAVASLLGIGLLALGAGSILRKRSA